MLKEKENIFFLKRLWNHLTIRWKLFLIILPSVIVPLVILVSISSWQIYQHLETQGHQSYSTYLEQVANNVEFVYNQYAQTLANMVKIPSVEQELLRAPYKNITEEIDSSNQLIGDAKTIGGLRNTVEERIEGDVFIVEMDRRSLSNDENYKIHPATRASTRPVYEKIIQTELFKRIKNDNRQRLVFGQLEEDSFTDEQRSFMLFPYYYQPPVNEEDTFEKFIIVHLQDTFVSRFYDNISVLEYGTLYILDINNKIISKNHPSDWDYYIFDDEKGEYILSEGDELNPEDSPSFVEYKMLNTDESILNTPKVSEVLSQLTLDNYYDAYDSGLFQEKIFVKHGNVTYLMVFQYEESSQTKYIYFHPVRHFQKPIYRIIMLLLILSIITFFLITVVSILLSKSFTKPINKLVSTTKVIAKGDYDHFIDTQSTDEIGELTNNFNKMIKNIKAYQDQLLSAEREKSELELASRIQTCLIPVVEHREHYELYATMVPATMVGGDYYDIIGEQDGKLWLGIGDVSGHGLMSGLIMMMAQTAFNAFLLNDKNITSDRLISNVNKVLYQNIKERLGEDHFMTLSFLVASDDGGLRYSGCHEDILIYRKKTGKVERTPTNGVWLGLIPDIEESTIEKELHLDSGDILFLYTDGLIEAMDTENNQYDLERLMSKLEEFASLPVEDIGNKIKDDVFEFLNEQMDDITFIIMRKK